MPRSRLGRRLFVLLRPYIALTIVLAVWQFVAAGPWTASFGNLPRLLPAPTAVLATGFELLKSGVLLSNAADSLRRVLLGFVFAAGIAIPIGAAMARSRLIAEQLNPIVQLTRPIPPIAWIPLLMVWMGIGDKQSITVIFIAAFFPILLNTLSGVQAVPKEFIEAARTLGATKVTIIRRVILPAALPIIIIGLRLGLGFAWVAVIAAELIGAPSGLGYMLQSARYQLQSDVVVLAMVSIGVIGLAVDSLFVLLTSRFVKWHVRRGSGAS